MKKNFSVGLFSALGLLMLILDSKTAILGAREGIALCIRSLLPSLFPFILLSNLMISGLNGAGSTLLRPLGRFWGIPAGSESIFVAGILGGYPTGAQMVHQAWSQGQLSKDDARRMLGFCNNAGPAFLFGILAPFFSSQKYLWHLWAIHILSAVMAGVLLPGKSAGAMPKRQGQKPSVTGALKRSVAVMGYICGWVVLFRVLFAFCSRWFLWLFPVEMQVTFYGLLELAGGCCSLGFVDNEAVRFVICSGILAFGGLCVAMQTASVAGSLGMGQYFTGKLIQSVCSMLLSILVVTGSWKYRIFCLLLVLLAGSIWLILRKIEKNSSNPSMLGV